MQPIWQRLRMVGAMLMVLMAVACAAPPQPFEYHDDRDEKPGPGLFSGEAGGWVIDGEKGAAPPENKRPPAANP